MPSATGTHRSDRLHPGAYAVGIPVLPASAASVRTRAGRMSIGSPLAAPVCSKSHARPAHRFDAGPSDQVEIVKNKKKPLRTAAIPKPPTRTPPSNRPPIAEMIDVDTKIMAI